MHLARMFPERLSTKRSELGIDPTNSIRLAGCSSFAGVLLGGCVVPHLWVLRGPPSSELWSAPWPGSSGTALRAHPTDVESTLADNETQVPGKPLNAHNASCQWLDLLLCVAEYQFGTSLLEPHARLWPCTLNPVPSGTSPVSNRTTKRVGSLAISLCPRRVAYLVTDSWFPGSF